MNYSQSSTAAEQTLTPYITEIEIVAQRGHKDRSTEHLLLALVDLHQSQPGLIEDFIAVYLQRAAQDRLEITPRAFRLSLLTAIKLYLRNRGIKDYEFFSVTDWKQVVLECLTNLEEEFIRYCLRDVSTVKIYRYMALQILGGLLRQSQFVRQDGLCILDGGCSINIGLKCLNDVEIFQPIEIAPEILNGFHGKLPKIALKYARGIDKYPPSLERTLASLFPSEVKLWEDLYTHLYYLNKKKIQYHQQDILYLDQNEDYRERFDLVFLSSLLRRFPPHQIAQVLIQVNYALTRHGFVVINEHTSKEIIEGGGTYATFILSKPTLERIVQHSRYMVDLYELLNLSNQLLVYPDENCQHVFPGKDFYTFQKQHSRASITPEII